jgi:hypothetical protein
MQYCHQKCNNDQFVLQAIKPGEKGGIYISDRINRGRRGHCCVLPGSLFVKRLYLKSSIQIVQQASHQANVGIRKESIAHSMKQKSLISCFGRIAHPIASFWTAQLFITINHIQFQLTSQLPQRRTNPCVSPLRPRRIITQLSKIINPA